MPESDSELVASLAGLPPDTQRAAIKVLTEWGCSPLGANSFPVRMALVVRLQLWALTRSATKLAAERAAIADLVTGLTLALAREGEIRESFLREFRSEERGEAQRLLSLAEAIEAQVRSLLARLAKFEQDINRAATRAVPSPPPERRSSRHGGRVLARLLRTARRLERLEPPAVFPTAKTDPPPAVPFVMNPGAVPTPPEPVPARRGRASVFIHGGAVFVAALAYAWIITPEPAHLADALVRAAPAAAGFALFCARCHAVANPCRP